MPYKQVFRVHTFRNQWIPIFPFPTKFVFTTDIPMTFSCLKITILKMNACLWVSKGSVKVKNLYFWSLFQPSFHIAAPLAYRAILLHRVHSVLERSCLSALMSPVAASIAHENCLFPLSVYQRSGRVAFSSIMHSGTQSVIKQAQHLSHISPRLSITCDNNTSQSSLLYMELTWIYGHLSIIRQCTLKGY